MFNAGKISVDMVLNDSQYRRGLVNAQKATKNSMSAIRTSMGFLATGIVFAKAKNALSDFEEELANVASIASDLNINIIREEMLKLSDTLGLAKDNTLAFYQAYSAGMRGSEKEMSNFTGTISALAKTIRADQSMTVSAVTSLMNAYSLSVKDAGEVSDWFYQVIKQGKTTGTELAVSLGRIVSTANTAGLSLNELGAGISALSRIMPTQHAIVALNQAFLSFIKPSEQAKRMAEELGIEFSATSLKTKGLIGSLNEIRKASKGNVSVMAQLFGSVRALKSVSFLAGEGFDDLSNIMGEFENKSGSALKAFEVQTSRINTTFSSSMVAMNKGLINFGNAFSPLLTGLYDGIHAFGSMLQNMDKFDIVLASVTAGVLALRSGLVSGSIIMAKNIQATLMGTKAVQQDAIAVAEDTIARTSLNKAIVWNMETLSMSIPIEQEENAIRMGMLRALQMEVVGRQEATVATLEYAGALEIASNKMRSFSRYKGSMTRGMSGGIASTTKSMGMLNTAFSIFLAWEVGTTIGKWLMQFKSVNKAVKGFAETISDYYFGGAEAKAEASSMDSKITAQRMDDLKKWKDVLIQTGTMTATEFNKAFGKIGNDEVWKKVRNQYLSIDETIRKGGADVQKTLKDNLLKKIYAVDKGKRDKLYENFKKEMGFDIEDLFNYDINSDTFKKGENLIKSESERLIQISKQEQKRRYMELLGQGTGLNDALGKMSMEAFDQMNKKFKMEKGINILDMIHLDPNSTKYKELETYLEDMVSGDATDRVEANLDLMDKETKYKMIQISMVSKSEKEALSAKIGVEEDVIARLILKRKEAIEQIKNADADGAEKAKQEWIDALITIDSKLKDSEKKQKEYFKELDKPLQDYLDKLKSAGGVETVKDKAYNALVDRDLAKSTTLQDSTIDRMMKTMTSEQKDMYNELVTKNLEQGDAQATAQTDAILGLLKVMDRDSKEKDSSANKQIDLLSQIEKHLADKKEDVIDFEGLGF